MLQTAYKRVVLVTGASRGLGREIAFRFGSAGERVVVNYLASEEAATRVADEIIHAGGEAIIQRADVRSSSEVDAMLHDTVTRWGGVDVLVNNAGITNDGLILRMKEQSWEDVMDTNLTGAFHATRAASKIMSKQAEGHIINISSLVGAQGREGQANYSASKAGLIGLTKACAHELGRFNIKVNAVLPGYIPTEMSGDISSDVRERILRENALHRVSDPREAAEFIYRLSLMNNVSGQVFNLDSRIV